MNEEDKEMVGLVVRELLVGSIRAYFLWKETQKLFGMTEEEIEAEYKKEWAEFEKRDAKALLEKIEKGGLG